MKQRTPSPPSDTRHAEDLSALERRGLLSDAEERRLNMALAASETLRCSHQLGRDFDELQTICDGDAALIERLAGSVRVRYAGTKAVRVRPFAYRALPWVGVMSLLLVSAAAGASLWPYARALVMPSPSVAPSVAAPLKAVKQARRASPARSSTVVNDDFVPSAVVNAPNPKLDVTAPSRPNQPNEPVAAGSNAQASAPAKSASAVPVGSVRVEERSTITDLERRESAAALFSEANAARRRGDIERARVLYHSLRDAYPAASETLLSYVLLARVDLSNRAAAEALRQFDQYLRLAPGGALAEEACEGRATAYRQLGRSAEEAAAWRELLSRYPNSVYMLVAKDRLGELR